MGISEIVKKIIHGYDENDRVDVDRKVEEIKKVFKNNFNDVLSGPYALSSETMSKIKQESNNAAPSRE